MSLSNIDTFEQDVAHELKKKEATVRNIATAGGDVGNIEPEPKKIPVVPIVLGLLCLASSFGCVFSGYIYYQKQVTVVEEAIALQLPVVKTTMQLLAEISPTFPDTIGMFVTGFNKSDPGYTLTISSFSPVYAYMLRNERVYANDVAKSLGVTQGIEQSRVEAMSESTTTSTTTVIVVESTTTEPTPTEDTVYLPFIFSDITISNQNIRVGRSGTHAIYYAFIENKALVFSPTPEGILALKNAILR